MRIFLVPALAALTLGGCVYADGPYRHAGYGAYGYGQYGSPLVVPQQPLLYRPVHVQQPYRWIDDRRWADDRRYWRHRERRHHREHRGWWRQD